MLFCVDKETDVLKVIIAFHNFANTPNKDSVLEKKIVPTVSWSVGEAPRLVPLLNIAQWTKFMNIVMLRRQMVFKVRLLFCLTTHIAHANYVLLRLVYCHS
jgi:hypothetical protein